MKLTQSKTITIELTKQDAKNLEHEMKYACNNVSVFPFMEKMLALMEA